MAPQHATWPAPHVITIQCIGAVFTFINLYVVIIEIGKRIRMQNTLRFKSCSAKWLSFLSIIGGFLHAFTWMIHHVDGICIFLFSGSVYIGTALPIWVGLYQLDRLYHCFADKKVPGGYPKWLFYVMTTFGILYLLAWLAFFVSNEKTLKCGLTQKYEFYAIFVDEWTLQALETWVSARLALYLIWDITTLLLLVCKLRSMTVFVQSKSQHLVLKIRQNVTRIVILTIFYMMMTSLSIWHFKNAYYRHNNDWKTYIATGLFLSSSTTMSYAVFLRQPHNSKEYGSFLNRVVCLKLHYCCLCYRGDVVAQRDYFSLNYTVRKSGMETPLIDINDKDSKTGTAFNEFSNDDLPHIDYQAPNIPLMVTTNPTQSNVKQNESLITLARPHRMNTIWENVPRNDFLFDAETDGYEEFSNGFSFGLYLEYWRPNKHNSVLPKYSTLKEELTKNRHATISVEQWEGLRTKCEQIQANYTFIAKDIGTMNTICGVKPGSEMTVEHTMCVKLYTDFTVHQTIFKKQCRRLYRDEPIESVIARNFEIAHWCRLLKECIMFFGETMTASDVVYCGLNARLIFRSLHQRFECPLSTTTTKEVAMGFAEEERGIILKLKRANPKTRYLDVGPFTSFKHEDERLFAGSTLKIVDILIGSKSLKRYINALRMLEQIVSGHFIDFGEPTGALLLSLLSHVGACSVIDVLRECVTGTRLDHIWLIRSTTLTLFWMMLKM